MIRLRQANFISPAQRCPRPRPNPRPNPRPHHRRARGFSLFELVLVMTTIGIISAMAIPRYGRSLSNYRVRCAAQRIAADLQLAAADATASSTSRTVSFDVGQNEYQVIGLRDMDRPARTWQVHLGMEPYSSSLVSVDLDGASAIIFNGYGAPDRGGRIVVRSGDFTRTIEVDATTGRATIQ